MKRAHHALAWRPVAAALVLAASTGAWAQVGSDPTRLSLEELMAIEVSSAAKKPQALSDTATALHVITREDMRRAGVTSVPEALRLAPGVQVSRIDASRYAITIRGFASRYAGKLLVLQDGRTLFSPLFNGTFWEAQDLMLDDVERIEVIRGPGGTMWGTNAVNGVINIITRAARDTQGTLVQAQTGSAETGLALRHGGTLGDTGHFRAWAKLGHHDALTTADGSPAHDALLQKRAGFRLDLQPRGGDRLTVQGDVQETRADVIELDTQLSQPGVHFSPDTQTERGANLLLRWDREVHADHHLHLQAFVDRVEGRSEALDVQVDTLDLEFQQRLRLNPTHELTWGAGWRHVRDKTRGSLTVSMDPASASRDVYNAFVQDEMQLRPDLRLTVGSKFEHNDVTGLETQPSVRLHWQATPTDTFWAAISRAVETPSRATLNSQINYRVENPFSPFNPLPFPMVVGLRGNPDLVSQKLVSRELGYRGLFGHDVSVDLTVFHNSYDQLVTAEGLTVVPGAFVPPAPTFATYGFSNGLRGHAYGVELSSVWQVHPAWRLSGSVSTLRMKLSPNPLDSAFGKPGESPGYMAQLHSQHDLGRQLELDVHLYRIGKLPFPAIPAHNRLDLRLGWRVQSGLELSLTGRNLLRGAHAEFKPEDVQSSDIPRSWLLQSHWRF
jgi:iron complex outermembrane recepter protein